MATVQPQGEDIRRAVKWISDEGQYNPEAKLSDAEYLRNFFKK